MRAIQCFHLILLNLLLLFNLSNWRLFCNLCLFLLHWFHLLFPNVFLVRVRILIIAHLLLRGVWEHASSALFPSATSSASLASSWVVLSPSCFCRWFVPAFRVLTYLVILIVSIWPLIVLFKTHGTSVVKNCEVLVVIVLFSGRFEGWIGWLVEIFVFLFVFVVFHVLI